MTLRIFGIDWSGAAIGSEKRIWIAEVRDGEVVRLECGRERDEVARFLIDQAARDPEMLVGLDFAFSMPGWFFVERGLTSAFELWELVEREGEAWLSACETPFWGRRTRPRPAGVELYRTSELEMPAVAGVRAKSVFQIGGAGAVGTGSIRGMPVLRRLHDAGFEIWPFDRSTMPRVVEIYPRLLTGPVRKSDPAARHAYLGERHSSMSAEVRENAESCEDAFDAAVSALAMWQHRDHLLALRPADDPMMKFEGAIWQPSLAPVHAEAVATA